MGKRHEVGTFGPASDVRHVVKDSVRVDHRIPADAPRHNRSKHHGRGSGRARALDLIRQRGAVGATAMELGIAMVQSVRITWASGRRSSLVCGPERLWCERGR